MLHGAGFTGSDDDWWWYKARPTLHLQPASAGQVLSARRGRGKGHEGYPGLSLWPLAGVDRSLPAEGVLAVVAGCVADSAVYLQVQPETILHDPQRPFAVEAELLEW